MKASTLFENSRTLVVKTALAAGLAAGLALSALAFASAASTAVHAQPAGQPAAGAPADANPAANGPAANDPAGNATEASLISPEWLQILQKSGTFLTHARYGEVWKPAVTPQGWHPYPACYWKNTEKFGWYFDDLTDWGAIVHHHGRWTNDSEHGWIWVPGKEFSPGWVVWRTSSEYIGWAPQMPDQDIKDITSEQFNTSGQWIFMDAKKFGKKCTELLPANQTPVMLQKTKFVTDVRFVDGMAVYVLPEIFSGPYVSININYTPWPTWFFITHVINLNWIWTTLDIIIINPCGRK
jgi:hypothetical protein